MGFNDFKNICILQYFVFYYSTWCHQIAYVVRHNQQIHQENDSHKTLLQSCFRSDGQWSEENSFISVSMRLTDGRPIVLHTLLCSCSWPETWRYDSRDHPTGINHVLDWTIIKTKWYKGLVQAGQWTDACALYCPCRWCFLTFDTRPNPLSLSSVFAVTPHCK